MDSRGGQHSVVRWWYRRRCQHKIRYTGNRRRTLLWIFVFNSRSRRHPRAAQPASLMETATCQVCGATAAVRRIAGNLRADPDYASVQARCQNWPPRQPHGFVTGCENLDQAVRMSVAARRPPRPLFLIVAISCRSITTKLPSSF
jgi:hypothetical protein